VKIVDALLAIGLEECESRWNVRALCVGGREIVHLHDDAIEIRLTRKEIAKLVDERVWRRARTSDWVGVAYADMELAVELARRAVEANRR
jgi:hypothetical protein